MISTRFLIPVYFFLGHYDVNATYWLAEDYFSKLEAPIKRLTIFEDSGHGMIWQEPDKFHALMQQVVAETYPKSQTIASANENADVQPVSSST